VLSRSTEPTQGEIHLHGRVGSLLEVGTGFHPELTGRENIYLNGAILGMSRREIQRKFDEIVEFAEIERFLDTPVKRYSSGMYVRLAFAVAAHLEPEILVVDEVLAVGDAGFQKKCLGKMGDVAREGRTVLLVSHNMGAVTALCPTSIWLAEGHVVEIGRSADLVSRYFSYHADSCGSVTFEPKDSTAYFTRISILDEHAEPTNTLQVESPFIVRLEYVSRDVVAGLEVSFSVWNQHGAKVFYCARSLSEGNVNDPGVYRSNVKIPGMFLAPGSYTITAGLHIPNVAMFDYLDHRIAFRMEETGSPFYSYLGSDIGSVLVDFPWQTERCAVAA
jgi:lipopolysaccharide transport system ATP-binding protein